MNEKKESKKKSQVIVKPCPFCEGTGKCRLCGGRGCHFCDEGNCSFCSGTGDIEAISDQTL